MTPQDIQSQLGNFTGTNTYHRFYPGVLFTDGIHFLCEHAKCFWLLNSIWALQANTDVKKEPFQVYTLKVDLENECADLLCTDGNENILHQEHIFWTDFPLAEVTLYFTDGVILLPSEY